MSNAKGRKVESCSRIKDGNGNLAQGRTKCKRFGRIILRMIYYNIDNQEQVAVHMCSFNVFRIENYFAGELTKNEAEVQVGRLKMEGL